MAEETCMENVGQNEDICFGYLEILPFVKFQNVVLEILVLVLTIRLSDLTKQPISHWLQTDHNSLDLIHRVDQPQNQTSC